MIQIIFRCFSLFRFHLIWSNISHTKGYIDVGDGCWRPNVLMTRFGCWWQVTSPTSRVRHQHQIAVTNITIWHIMMLVTDWNVTNMRKNVTNMRKNVTNILFVTNISKWSSSWSHQHNDVTNITVTVTLMCHMFYRISRFFMSVSVFVMYV